MERKWQFGMQNTRICTKRPAYFCIVVVVVGSRNESSFQRGKRKHPPENEAKRLPSHEHFVFRFATRAELLLILYSDSF